MSDVLIKRMEMPTSCNACMFDVYGQCLINKNIEGKDELTHSCPLVSIPKHGRLIDADALLNLLNHCMFPSDMVTTVALGMATNWIKEAPTVIEAEEGE